MWGGYTPIRGSFVVNISDWSSMPATHKCKKNLPVWLQQNITTPGKWVKQSLFFSAALLVGQADVTSCLLYFHFPFSGLFEAQLFILSDWDHRNCRQPLEVQMRRVTIRIWKQVISALPGLVYRALHLQQSRPFLLCRLLAFLLVFFFFFFPQKTANPPHKITSAKESFMFEQLF